MSPSTRSVPISDLMTTHVCTAAPDEGLYEIWRLLERERCHHIPIVKNEKPIGIISTYDLVRFARKHGAKRLSDHVGGTETASDIMSTDLETIGLDESVDTAIDRIGRGDIHSLLVVDEHDNLAGIVTNHDLLHYLLG